MNVLEVKSKKDYADSIIENFSDLNKILETNPKMVQREMGMNRQQFRDMKRDQKKHADNIKGFSVKQEETVRMMLRANEKYYLQRIGDYATAMTAAVNATLHDMLEGQFTKEVATQFWHDANELAMEHLEKSEGRIISMEDWVQMEKRVKEFIFKALDEKKSAKETKESLRDKFPKLSGAQVQNAYAEAKEEWEAVNQIAEILDEPKKMKIKKTKKEDKPQVTMTPEAGEQLEGIVEELKAEGKAIEIAIKEVPEGEAQKEIEEIKEEIEERFMPTEVQSTSITEQLKGKLVLFEGKKTALSNDIANCEAKIKELENIIKEKHKGIAEYQVKAKNVEQMLELAKNIEE